MDVPHGFDPTLILALNVAGTFIFGLSGGNIYHGAMTPDQLFTFRPAPGFADYRTPIKNLYLCGSGTHPGGGVWGAPGWNSAHEILRDIGRG